MVTCSIEVVIWMIGGALDSDSENARCAPSVLNITDADFNLIGPGVERYRPEGVATNLAPVEYDVGVHQRVGGNAPLARVRAQVARPTIALPVAS
eukprot:scaffold100326_cov51-Phaeocystis_antarctica.AAC.1